MQHLLSPPGIQLGSRSPGTPVLGGPGARKLVLLLVLARRLGAHHDKHLCAVILVAKVGDAVLLGVLGAQLADLLDLLGRDVVRLCRVVEHGR